MSSSLAEPEQINLLLVDDDPDTLVIIRDMLRSSRSHHYEITHVESYQEGLSLLHDRSFDVALVDYRLGPDDGIAFIQEAARFERNTPMILLTGYSDEQIDLMAIRAGAADFLNKNEITSTTLERAIRYAYLRKLAEDRNSENEARLRYQAELLSKVPVPIVSTDDQFCITYWNEAAEETFGWAAFEITGQNTADVFQPVYQNTNRDDMLNQLLVEGYFDGEALYQRKDGAYLTVQASIFALRDEMGGLLGVVSSLRDISERKRFEIELEQSERRYRDIVKFAPSAFYEVDFRGNKFVSVNETMAEFTGYSTEELMHMDPASLLDPASQAAFQERIVKWMNGIKPDDTVEYRVIAKDGHEIYAVLNTTFTRDENGLPLGATVIAHDITLRKSAEILNQSLNEIHQAIHGSQDFDTVIKAVMSLAVPALGCDTAAVSLKQDGNWIIRYVHGFSADIIGTQMDDSQEPHAVLSIQTQEPVAIEDAAHDARVDPRHMQKWGIQSVLVVPIVMPSEALGVIFFNYNHSVTRFSSAQVDFARKLASTLSLALQNIRLFQDLQKEIRDHQRTEEALRVSEERFRLALENSPITVFNQDLDLNYTWIYNPNIGLLPEEIFGKTDEDIFTPAEAQELNIIKKRVIQTGQKFRCEVEVTVRGLHRIMDVIVEPVIYAGKMVGIRGVSVDITNQIMLQRQFLDNQSRIEIQRQIIEQRERERLQIARDLHDGPLQDLICLTLNLKGLEEVLYKSPEAVPVMDEMKAALQHTIIELRSYASELRPPALSSFGLEKAIASHLQSFQQKHPEIEVVFHAQQEGDILPDAIRLALYRIYQELLNNVIKHAHATLIVVSLEKDQDLAVLSVHDNGQGFQLPAEWVELARHNHLGLVGIRERAEAVGGSVEIETDPGKGAIVTVSIPLNTQHRKS